MLPNECVANARFSSVLAVPSLYHQPTLRQLILVPITTRWRRIIYYLFKTMLEVWHDVQVSYRGKYSLERLQAVDEYSKCASPWRVMLVCVVTPLPALALVLALEAVPLANPNEGVKSNTAAWLRSFMMSFSVGLGLIAQVKGMIPDLPLTAINGLFVALIASIVSILTMWVIALVTVYPLPFGNVLSVVPFMILFPCCLLIAVGKQAFRENPNLVTQLQKQLYLLLAQATLLWIYPPFHAVFTALPPMARNAALLTLPMIKLTMKNIVAWSAAHLEDYIPEIVVFSVDLFNSLYVAACMQTAGTPLTTALVLAFDGFHFILACRDIDQRTQSIQALFPPGMKWTNHPSRVTPGRTSSTHRLFSTVLRICERPDLLSNTIFTKIRLRSPIKLKISSNNRAVLDSLIQQREKVPTKRRSRHTSLVYQLLPSIIRKSIFRIHPILLRKHLRRRQREMRLLTLRRSKKSVHLGRRRLSVTQLSPTKKTQIIDETLKLLFQSEYLILVEYIECTTPLLYCIYISALYVLPNAMYYPQTRNLTDTKLIWTAINLVFYTALELMSFLGFHFILQRRLGFSPVHLAAFVLEKQWKLIQGRVFVWIVYILPFTLQHFGVDYTFKFNWIHDG